MTFTKIPRQRKQEHLKFQSSIFELKFLVFLIKSQDIFTIFLKTDEKTDEKFLRNR